MGMALEYSNAIHRCKYVVGQIPVQKHYQKVNSLNPDQDRHSVCPGLGPNCLQRLSADNKSCYYNE